MKLKEIEGVDGSDYINASFLDVSGPTITVYSGRTVDSSCLQNTGIQEEKCLHWGSR